MPARVSPTDRIRDDIDGLFTSDRDLGEVLEDVARLGARLILQTALEAEVTEFLGRERYARGERAHAGSRNGYAPATVKTTAGPVTLERPKLRGTDEQFASRLLAKHVTKTNALESLVIAGYVRGLSTRDVEASLADALGARRRCRSRPCPGSVRPSARSSMRGSSAASPVSSWSTCTWMPATSASTTAPAPNRCWWRGASPATGSRGCSPGSRSPRSPTTPSWGSCAGSSPAGCVRRC